MPPSTVRSAPVMKLAREEHRKAMASATSSARPQRRIGIIASTEQRTSARDVAAAVSGVSIGPGDTTLRRIPRCMSTGSVPALRANARMNPLLPAYNSSYASSVSASRAGARDASVDHENIHTLRSGGQILEQLLDLRGTGHVGQERRRCIADSSSRCPGN
jgi:hypothetical protein